MCEVTAPNFLDTIEMMKSPSLDFPSSPSTWWSHLFQGSEIPFSPTKPASEESNDLPVLRLTSNDLKIEFNDLTSLQPISPLSSIPIVDADILTPQMPMLSFHQMDESLEDSVTEDSTPSPGSGGECDYDTHIFDSGVDADSDDSSSFSPMEDRTDHHSSGSTCEASRSGGKIGPRSGAALVAGITQRERGLLQRQGITVPSVLPLTKPEERTLRQALRKIRNKASAQRSRRNKEGYIKGLEQRVELCTKVNVDLETKVSVLQKTNMTLLDQLNELRKMVYGGSNSSTENTAAATLPQHRETTNASSADQSRAPVLLTMVVVVMGIQMSPFATGMAGSSSNSADGGVVFRSRTLQGVVPGVVPSPTSYTGAVIPVLVALAILVLVAAFITRRRQRQAPVAPTAVTTIPRAAEGCGAHPQNYHRVHDDWLHQSHPVRGLSVAQKQKLTSLVSTLKSSSAATTGT